MVMAKPSQHIDLTKYTAANELIDGLPERGTQRRNRQTDRCTKTQIEQIDKKVGRQFNRSLNNQTDRQTASLNFIDSALKQHIHLMSIFAVTKDTVSCKIL